MHLFMIIYLPHLLSNLCYSTVAFHWRMDVCEADRIAIHNLLEMQL